LNFLSVTKPLPFDEDRYNTIVSNSALEHIEQLDPALVNIRKTLKPGGSFYFKLASNHAYEWWPCEDVDVERYLSYHPVYNYFSTEQWKERLEQAGLELVEHHYYLSRSATRIIMYLYFHYSNVHMTDEPSRANSIVLSLEKMGHLWLSRFWRVMFNNIKILAGDKGGGVMIVARRPESTGYEPEVILHFALPSFFSGSRRQSMAQVKSSG